MGHLHGKNNGPKNGPKNRPRTAPQGFLSFRFVLTTYIQNWRSVGGGWMSVALWGGAAAVVAFAFPCGRVEGLVYRSRVGWFVVLRGCLFFFEKYLSGMCHGVSFKDPLTVVCCVLIFGPLFLTFLRILMYSLKHFLAMFVSSVAGFRFLEFPLLRAFFRAFFFSNCQVSALFFVAAVCGMLLPLVECFLFFFCLSQRFFLFVCAAAGSRSPRFLRGRATVVR